MIVHSLVHTIGVHHALTGNFSLSLAPTVVLVVAFPLSSGICLAHSVVSLTVEFHHAFCGVVGDKVVISDCTDFVSFCQIFGFFFPRNPFSLLATSFATSG